MFCFEPYIALGALVYGIETQWHKQEDLTGAYAQVQTCTRGIGAYLKGDQEWVAGGVQYGFVFDLTEKVTLTIQPQGGGSYSNTINPKNGIRQITKFHAGLGIVLSYKNYSVSVEYNHMSNGQGITLRNEGQDNIGVQVGYTFGR